jgi:hypothetical protein
MIILERRSALSEFRVGGGGVPWSPMESTKVANGSVAPETLRNTALGTTGQWAKVRAAQAETMKETRAYILAVKTYTGGHTSIRARAQPPPPP